MTKAEPASDCLDSVTSATNEVWLSPTRRKSQTSFDRTRKYLRVDLGWRGTEAVDRVR
ncbi:hypothetical protein Pd630_LPD10046 (plasmid) [Rhodococcus opacus PD630]|nr:hypothetical protein Pd630_LPD10046 [Rhodococcus opacus PD630]